MKKCILVRAFRRGDIKQILIEMLDRSPPELTGMEAGKAYDAI